MIIQGDVPKQKLTEILMLVGTISIFIRFAAGGEEIIFPCDQTSCTLASSQNPYQCIQAAFEWYFTGSAHL